jgi:hypothetical protein
MQNHYMIEALVRERLEEARSWAARAAMGSGFRPAPGWLRALAGGVLIRLGHALAGETRPEAGGHGRATA